MEAERDPDVAWVAGLAGVSEARAARALGEAQAETRLFRHLERMHRLEGRSSYIEIDAPLELYALVRLLRPIHVVEVGVSSGVSSAYLLQALDRVGRGSLHSVDLPKPDRRPESRRRNPSWAIPAGRSSGWAVPRPLLARWDLRLGDKKVILPRITEEPVPVGLFVYDVPHSESQAARDFAAVDRRFRVGSVAIADHGPGAGLCPPLGRWAKSRGARAVRCRDLGLFGFRSATGRASG